MDNHDQAEFGFLDHLEELRVVFFRIILLIAILFPVCFYFSPRLLELLIAYLCPPDFKLRYFSPLEPFWVQMKVAFFGSVVLALPLIFWQIWIFIAPGLYRRERLFVIRLTISAMLLFVVGAGFSGLFILPLLMQFSLGFASAALEPAIGLEKFISLALMLLFGFGLMFQFPIAIFMLVRGGIVKLETFKKQRPLIFIIILFLSAILTPPDVLSQIMMGVPTYLLFELSLLFAGLKKPKTSPDEPDDDTPTPDSKNQPPQEEVHPPEPDNYFDYESDSRLRKRCSLPRRSPASCIRRRRK